MSHRDPPHLFCLLLCYLTWFSLYLRHPSSSPILHPFMCQQNYHREDFLSFMAASSLFKLLFCRNVPYVILPTAFLWYLLTCYGTESSEDEIRVILYTGPSVVMFKSWYILFSLLRLHNRPWLMSRQQVYEPVLVWTFGRMHSLIQRCCV